MKLNSPSLLLVSIVSDTRFGSQFVSGMKLSKVRVLGVNLIKMFRCLFNQCVGTCESIIHHLHFIPELVISVSLM